MQHSAYVNGANIEIGAAISIATKTFSLGDTLALEFPNNSRTPAKVVLTSPNELDVEIDGETWRLRPHAPSDRQVYIDLAGFEASFWTVQTKL